MGAHRIPRSPGFPWSLYHPRLQVKVKNWEKGVQAPIQSRDRHCPPEFLLFVVGIQGQRLRKEDFAGREGEKRKDGDALPRVFTFLLALSSNLCYSLLLSFPCSDKHPPTLNTPSKIKEHPKRNPIKGPL